MLFRQFLLIFLISAVQPVIAQSEYGNKIANAAVELTNDQVVYNGAYFSIPYPNGDIPEPYGVCTDVIIRTYRKLGVDLQKEVHLDMKANFKSYPQLWGLNHTDTNIDHRRVSNLRTFFSRKGTSITVTQDEKNYKPGDIVSWVLSSGLTHIGVVSNKKVPHTNRYYIVHNIGAGQVLEDCLFSFKITGHYRYEQ